MEDALWVVEQQERLLLLQWKAAISATCVEDTAQGNKQNPALGQQGAGAYPSLLPMMVCRNFRAEICPRNFR